MLIYTKILDTYVYDIAANFLDFARDEEASALVLGEDLEMICIQTEASRWRLIQDEDMEQEHRIFWGYIQTKVEMA